MTLTRIVDGRPFRKARESLKANCVHLPGDGIFDAIYSSRADVTLDAPAAGLVEFARRWQR